MSSEVRIRVLLLNWMKKAFDGAQGYTRIGLKRMGKGKLKKGWIMGLRVQGRKNAPLKKVRRG
ncbi:hypothetical protein F2P79_000408 [Pimephales promelas]|nr:hypothetical protein F2P79_000408 [Pimephales promelas]